MGFDPQRYEQPEGWFRPCGRSGLRLPAISFGLWHNFGAPPDGTTEAVQHDRAVRLLRTAFDLGITHFDLANNYGPPAGAAEERCGAILRAEFAEHRDELLISSKAGFEMWPGPYGDGGSRKYLIASCDASLRRLGLDHLDIFYHHRPDPATPLVETLAALDHIVRSGRALYVGIDAYTGAMLQEVERICSAEGLVRPIVQLVPHNLLERHLAAQGGIATAAELGLGVVCFCPLAQGRLAGRYVDGVPADSRIASDGRFLKREALDASLSRQLRALGRIAASRGQTLAQLALAWVLAEPGVCSALIGASKPEQLHENVAVRDTAPLSEAEREACQQAVADEVVVG